MHNHRFQYIFIDSNTKLTAKVTSSLFQFPNINNFFTLIISFSTFTQYPDIFFNSHQIDYNNHHKYSRRKLYGSYHIEIQTV